MRCLFHKEILPVETARERIVAEFSLLGVTFIWLQELPSLPLYSINQLFVPSHAVYPSKAARRSTRTIISRQNSFNVKGHLATRSIAVPKPAKRLNSNRVGEEKDHHGLPDAKMARKDWMRRFTRVLRKAVRTKKQPFESSLLYRI